jgi:putative PEP-CTERM system TPR-repeat lipoprotein
MNKILKRFLGVCVICLPVACSGSLTDDQYVERAQDYLDRGELEAATIELKNALLKNHENAQARMLLGGIQLEVGNAAAAEKELRRASEVGVADGAVLPLLARALLAQGKHEELQALPLENLTRDQKAEVLAAQGLGELEQEELDAAEVDAATELIDQAVSLAPQSTYAGVATASLLVANKEYALARKELDGVLERDAAYAPAWSLLGDLETYDRNLAQAEAAYTKAIENSADNFDDELKRTMVRIQQKKYAEAQKDIDVLKKRSPQHAGVNFMQGLIYFYNNRFPEAREAFELTLRSNESHLQAVYYLGQTHLRLGNRVQAEEYGRQFHSAAPRSIPGRKLMATIELGNGQYAVAEELIRPVVAFQEDDVVALNLLAKALLKQDRTDEAIELLEKAVSLQPDSAVAQLRLGTGLLAAGKYDSGVGRIEKALEMDPQLQQADVLLVQYYLERKDFDKALATAEDNRDRHPDSAATYNLIGRVQLVAGQETDAAKAFTRAREIAPGDPVASHSLAALAVRKQEYQEARGYYQDVLEYHDNDLSTLLKLAVLDGVEKKEQLMLEHLQQAATAHPKAVRPKVLLARYYLAQGKPAKVQPLMLELSKKQRQSPAALEVMALAQLAQKQYPEAKYGLEQLIEQQPDSAQAHFLLANAYAGLGDRAGLKRELERTIELVPRHFAARLALARLLLLEGEKDKVTEQLAVLNELSPDHTDVLRLKASLARVQGDQETASALLEDVFETSPGTDSMLSVARQKWAMGERAEALELQEQWAEEHPDDLTATLALAGTYSQQDQVEPAIAEYQQALEKDGQNVAALNGLAWHLRNKQPARALEYAERAAELAPESTLVMDTLAVVLLKNGQVKRAKRSIERVYAKKPNEPAVRYHRAMIDAAAGDKAAAIAALQALLGEGGDFSEKAEAQQLLTELQAGG